MKQNYFSEMSTKFVIFILIFIYLIIQNLISVYVMNISLDYNTERLALKNYKPLHTDPRSSFSKNHSHYKWKKEFNNTASVATTTARNKSTSAPTKLIHHAVPKEGHTEKKLLQSKQVHPQPQSNVFSYITSYHYLHMKNFTRMIGLYSKLKKRFSQNLNLSFPFNYTIKNEALCWPGLYLVNLILSAPHDFQIRSDIRGMWGDPKWKKVTRSQVVYLLGTSNDKTINALVLAENKRFGDIVQIDFKDSYDNLTLKVLSGFHWTNEFCPNVEWVMKSDTDVIVNIFKLTGFLKYYSKKVKNPHSKILCKPKPAKELFPLRNHTKYEKWNVNEEEYPFNNYPPSCYGPAYIISRRLIPKFYAAADKRYPFRMEDVYYTGILPQLVDEDVNILNIEPLFAWRPKGLTNNLSNKLMVFEMKTHYKRVAANQLWKKIIKRFIKHSSPSDKNKIDKHS